MALTWNDTEVLVKDELLPSDYTKPTITTFSDAENIYKQRVFTVAKSGVEDPDPATTVAAIVTALNTAAEAVVEADYDTTGTVTGYASIVAISTNQLFSDGLFNDDATSYKVTTNIFVKTA